MFAFLPYLAAALNFSLTSVNLLICGYANVKKYEPFKSVRTGQGFGLNLLDGYFAQARLKLNPRVNQI